jgi:plasmid maintenance system killer protein
LTYNVARDTFHVVIRSFRCKKTERLFQRERVKEFANVASVALRRLAALDAAQAVTDLSH